MAKKADSAYDGTLIQIKRTNLSFDHDNVNADTEKLKFGEPLFTTSGNFLTVGDGTTATKNLGVFSEIPRSLAANQLFLLDQSNNRISFQDRDNTELFPKIRIFTALDSKGRPINNNNEIKVVADKNWYTVNTNGEITTTAISGDPKLSTVFPRAQRIAIKGMTEDTIPYISLCLSNAQRGSSDNMVVRNLQQSYSRITDIASEDGYIVVYVSTNAILSDCYLNVFGG